MVVSHKYTVFINSTVAESWERHPIGILGGSRYHFGVYDQCVEVNYPIKGQYCLSEVKLAPAMENKHSSHRKENLDRVYDGNAWKTILEVRQNIVLFLFFTFS